MKHRLLTLAGLLFFLAACGGQPDQAPAPRGPAATGSDQVAQARLPVAATSERYAAGKLSGVVDTYTQESITIDPEQRQQQLELEQKYLAAVRAVDKRVLTGQELLSYEMFEQERLDAISALEAGIVE